MTAAAVVPEPVDQVVFGVIAGARAGRLALLGCGSSGGDVVGGRDG